MKPAKRGAQNTGLIALPAALLVLALLSGCGLGTPDFKDDPRFEDSPWPKTNRQAVVPQPSAAEFVSLVAKGSDFPAGAEAVSPESRLGKAATQTPGLTLIKRQMVTLTGNMPVNTNGYRLEKAPNETSQWTTITNFSINRFTYQDLNLQNPIWLYRAVPNGPAPIKGSVTLYWDASPTSGVTNYSLRWGTNKVRTPLLTATASNLTSGVTYSFTVTALTASGESVATKAVSYLVP